MSTETPRTDKVLRTLMEKLRQLNCTGPLTMTHVAAVADGIEMMGNTCKDLERELNEATKERDEARADAAEARRMLMDQATLQNALDQSRNAYKQAMFWAAPNMDEKQVAELDKAAGMEGE